MSLNDETTNLHDLNTQDGKLNNVEALERVYYEYHGCYDEGTNVADALASGQIPVGFSEVIAI